MVMESTARNINRQEGADLLFGNYQDQKLHSRVILFGLLINSCPFNEDSEPNCLPCELHHLTLIEKLKYAESLSDRAVSEILQYHAECQENRLKTMYGAVRYFKQPVGR
ncbi:MAG: hypothetical protein A2511_07590 [Deltaproteobacteria bacterium RIFOXYD12_FULL_50_9]|nr:MAG: hypothetical protein A2511_07590 [Deltaproteobacteria bacterium RIFOXYD12_FULL_50_9]